MGRRSDGVIHLYQLPVFDGLFQKGFPSWEQEADRSAQESHGLLKISPPFASCRCLASQCKYFSFTLLVLCVFPPPSCVLTQCSVKKQAERQWQRANGGFPPACMCPFSCEPIYLTIKLFRLNFMYRSKFLLLLQSTLKLEFTYMGCEGFYEMCAE